MQKTKKTWQKTLFGFVKNLNVDVIESDMKTHHVLPTCSEHVLPLCSELLDGLIWSCIKILKN